MVQKNSPKGTTIKTYHLLSHHSWSEKARVPENLTFKKNGEKMLNTNTAKLVLRYYFSNVQGHFDTFHD